MLLWRVHLRHGLTEQKAFGTHLPPISLQEERPHAGLKGREVGRQFEGTRILETYASASHPRVFTSSNYARDPTGAETMREVELPEWLVRQQWLAQDPLASVHHYAVVMRIIVAGAFGVRMCFRCPDCNADHGCSAVNEGWTSCSDYMGNNHKSMGGYAGIATALAFANEFQGDDTPQGHGFVAFANVYQYITLQNIGAMLNDNVHNLPAEEMLGRITNFMEHLHREDHFDDDQHQANVDALEEEFHNNNFGPHCNVHLSVRPKNIHCNSGADDAHRFQKEYESDVQFIFSHVHHHWHPPQHMLPEVENPHVSPKF